MIVPPRTWPRPTPRRGSRAGWMAVLSLTLLASAACSVPLMKLPEPGDAPATDGAMVLEQATASCRTINSFSAEIGVSGKVGGRRLRTRILAGLASPDSAFLDAPAPFGASIFMFAARDNDATLLLPRDRRVLEHGRPGEVLEAITGLPLGPADLRLALTGCALADGAGEVRQIGDDWRVFSGPRELYAHRAKPNAPWQIVAAVYRQPGTPEWRAEYKTFEGGLPKMIRLTSIDSRRFDLQLTLSQVERNPALGDDTFQLRIPSGFDPITLQELRDAGPAGASDSGNE
jgi:hypothetical protein